MPTTAAIPIFEPTRDTGPATPTSDPRVITAVHIGGLLLTTAIVFSHGFVHEFTNWDDIAYIVENPTIRELSLDGIASAFTSFHVLNYNPLHIASYAIDHAIWGLEPAGFFLANLLFHGIAGVLLYLLARRWLHSPNGALLVAALFLVHPSRVESVVWLSQRKDVLSACFVFGALLAYYASLDANGPERHRRRLALGTAAWLLFVLACLSKSQVIGLPLLLFSIDLYRRRAFGRALLGKLPYLAVSAVFTLVTLSAHAGEAKHGVVFPDCLLAPLAALPRYLLHIVWPVAQSPYHDFPPGQFLAWPVLLCGVATAAGLGWIACRSWRGERLALVAIVWFLAFTLPVLGLVKINVRIADRYLYLAIVGAAIVVTRWLERKVAAASRRERRVWVSGTVATVTLLAISTAFYVPTYRNSETLWTRVLRVWPGSSIAHSNLAHHYLGEGRVADAVRHYDADLASPPIFESSLLGRALVHEVAGEKPRAEELLTQALNLRPHSSKARAALANFLERNGHPERARRFREQEPSGTRSHE